MLVNEEQLQKLHYSAHNGYFNIVRFIIFNGANTNDQYKGHFSLHISISSEHKDIVATNNNIISLGIFFI